VSFARLALIAACLSGPAGCAEPVDSDDDRSAEHTDVPTAFERDLLPRLQACTACHSGDAPDAQLDLTELRTATLDVPSRQLDMALITPGDHLESYLWHKVNGSQGVAGGAGARMPLGDAWTDEDVDLLARWIDLGAEP